MKYDELIKDLRICASTFTEPCEGCSHTEAGDCYNRLKRDAADAIEELNYKYQKALSELVAQEKPKWIPVRERLPKDGEFVLVCNDDGHMMIAKYESETLDWFHKYTNYDFDIWDNEEQGPVRYWIPLPEPPNGKTDG